MLSLTLPAPALRSAFAVLSKLVPDRVTLPVLGHIRIERVQNRIHLTGTDLDRWLTFTHLAEPDPITQLAHTLAALRWPREAGALLVPKVALRDALKAVDKDGSITFTLPDPPALKGARKKNAPPISLLIAYAVNGQPISTPVETLPADDFPPAPEVLSAHACMLDANARAALLEADQFSSTDTTRYVLNGVHIETRYGDKPCAPVLVATDGRRLYRRGVATFAPLGVNLTVPSGVVSLLGHPALLAHDWRLFTDKDTKNAHITAGPWKLVARLIEGNFPNYRQVIPDQDSSSAPLGPGAHRQLLDILGKLPTPPKDKACTEAVTLRFHPDRLGIEDPHSKASLIVPGVVCKGQPKVISLNRYFLRELLTTGPGTFRVIDALSPLRYDTTTDAVHVVMPMRVA